MVEETLSESSNSEGMGQKDKKPLTLEDIDKGFSLAWVELFKQKHELEGLIRENFERHNELIKRILTRLTTIENELKGLKHG